LKYENREEKILENFLGNSDRNCRVRIGNWLSITFLTLSRQMNLHDPIGTVSSIGPIYKKRLEKLNIFELQDLFYHFPFRYEDYSRITNIENLRYGQKVTICASIFDVSTYKSKNGKSILKAKLYDQSGVVSAAWFNQPYLKNQLDTKTEFHFSGEIKFFGKELTITSPTFEKVNTKNPVNTARILPIYPETNGLTSKWLRKQILKLLPLCIKKLPETLDITLTRRQNLLTIQEAIWKIHLPENNNDIELAKERLSFDEFFQIQTNAVKKRNDWSKFLKATETKISKNELDIFLKSLPFSITKSQEECIEQITKDLSRKTPMNRILQGDVGSGKTIVAAAAAFAAIKNSLKTLIMVPTEILAAQHFKTFTNLFRANNVKICLITKTHKDNLADITIGTHALLNLEREQYKKVGLIIIDEQHRFGVEQRSKLTLLSKRANLYPHFLTLTATPIPRTVALTLYGNLDLSVITQLPPGRKPIKTFIVPQSKRLDAYKFIRKHLRSREQAFIICPFIEARETLNSQKAAIMEFARLKKEVFYDIPIGLLHGRVPTKEKEKTINDFSEGSLKVLVATPVVEVGIDIPNATIMIIEGADRFGLAQLHQLRGRIGRSNKESFCLLFTDSQSEIALKRLRAVKTETSGTKLAEIDLRLRGPGEIFGTRQHGFPTLKIANFFDLNLIQRTRSEARELLESDPNLERHKNLKRAIEKRFNQTITLPN